MKTNLLTIIGTARLATGRWFLGLVLLCAAAVRAAEPTFTNVTATVAPGLPGVEYSSVAWGDYDSDGRLDFLITGYDYTGTHSRVSQLWRNTGSGFTNVTATLAPGLPGGSGTVAWGDYDNDGRLDFFLTGSGIWRNTASGFENVTASVAPGLSGGYATVAWADYDNDGRLDFLIAGSRSSELWRNTGSGFTNVTATVAPGLPGAVYASVAWGDYDNDGRLDFLFAGATDIVCEECDTPNASTQLWRNTGSRFENVTASVAPGLPRAFGTLAWGDYDNDGWLDFLVSGYAPHVGETSQVWRNTGNGFANVTATVAPALASDTFGAAAWGDYDNDGRLDILITKLRFSTSHVWRNTGSGFTNVTATVAPGLPGVGYSSVAWADYDSDGSLDFLITGSLHNHCDGCDQYGAISQLWRNNTAQTSPPPAVMTGLPGSVSQSSVTLNGSIHPHRQTANAWFIWGDSTNYGQVTAAQPMGNGNSFSNFSQTITGLTMGATYYYRAVGSNDQGQIARGVEQSFLLAAPGVTTSPVGDFRPNTATIKGLVTPNNLPTCGWFEWGFTPACDQVTPVQFLGHGFSATLSENLLGLAIGTNFYFRAVVSNNLGVAFGAVQNLVMLDTPFVCPGSISPTNRPHGNGGGSYSISVRLQCDWIVINTNSWITITSPTNGAPGGGNSLTYTLARNMDLQPRSGNVTIGGHNLFVSQTGANPNCVNVSGRHLDRGYGAAMGTVFFSAKAHCAWEVENTSPWITILSATNGVGSGQIVYAIEENPDMQSRSGYVRIGGDGFSINQYGRFYVSLPEDQIVALGGTATFSVTVNGPPNTYQWQFNGVDLVDGGGISGATTSNLVLTAVQYSQGGHYRCVASGYASSSATLTVAPTSDALAIDDAVDTDDVYDRFFWKTWSNSRGIWFGQTNTTHDGIDAVECSGLAPGEFASLEAKSGGPGLLSFWWKTAFASPSDNLLLSIGSSQSAALTNTTDWEQRSFTVPPGDVNLRWTFSNSSAGGQSQAWLDQVQFTPCDFRLWPYQHDSIGSMGFTGAVTLYAAADCPWNVVNTNSWITILSSLTNSGSDTVTYVVAANTTGRIRSGVIVIAGLNFLVQQYEGSSGNPYISLEQALETEPPFYWSTIGSPAWFGQMVMSRDGADAAQSGPVGDDGAVTASTTVNQPGTVLFWWKVSSETNKDYLKFFINGVQQTRISGEVDWQLLSYELTSVTNTLKWTYSKNDDEAVGQDRGWLDQVQFIPASATGSCVRAISPISATASPNSDTGSVSVIAATGCAWDVVNTNAWITHIASSGESNGFVRYTVSANNSREQRTGVMLIGGRPFMVTQPAGLPPCSHSISPTSRSHGFGPSTNAVYVTTQGGCAWSAFTTNEWITIVSGTSGTGNGTISYSIAVNPTPDTRTGKIQIGNLVCTITQSGVPGPSLAEALDIIGTPLLIWNAGSWAGQYSVTHDGVDAASSDGGSFTLTVNGPGTISFWWKISSPTNNSLRFYLGGSEQARITGLVDWEQRTITLPAGIQSLEWFYARNYAGPPPDRGWVDQVQFVPTPLCPVTLSPGNASYPTNFSTGSISVTAASGCAWSVFNSNSWISIMSGSNGTGNGSVTYTVAANPSAPSRSGNVQIADRVFLFTQSGTNPPAGCTFSISPTSRTHGSSAATNTVSVTAGAGCAWSVSNTNSWVNVVSGTNGTGSGVVVYSITANTSPNTRSGSVRIAGLNFTLTQFGAPGGCTFSISPTSRIHGYGAASNTVAVTADAGCAWSVSNTNSWINVVSGTNGTGSGVVAYSLSANNSPNTRSGSVQIAGLNFTLTQNGAPAGCTFSISPGIRTHGYGAASNTVAVTADAGCAWSVSNTNSWINVVSGTNGTGSGVVAYLITANDSPDARSGSVQIAGVNFTLTQFGAPGGGCTYVLSPTNRTHDFGSATGLVSVTTTAGCAWTAVESNSWVNIIAGHGGASNGVVRYLITANTNSAPRTGHIYIAGQTFTLTQLGKMPIIHLDGLLAGGGAMLWIDGNAGRTNVVECSEDLIYWFPISTNSSPNAVTDSTGTNAPRRFYRSYELP